MHRVVKTNENSSKDFIISFMEDISAVDEGSEGPLTLPADQTDNSSRRKRKRVSSSLAAMANESELFHNLALVQERCPPLKIRRYGGMDAKDYIVEDGLCMAPSGRTSAAIGNATNVDGVGESTAVGDGGAGGCMGNTAPLSVVHKQVSAGAASAAASELSCDSNLHALNPLAQSVRADEPRKPSGRARSKQKRNSKLYITSKVYGGRKKKHCKPRVDAPPAPTNLQPKDGGDVAGPSGRGKAQASRGGTGGSRGIDPAGRRCGAAHARDRFPSNQHSHPSQSRFLLAPHHPPAPGVPPSTLPKISLPASLFPSHSPSFPIPPPPCWKTPPSQRLPSSFSARAT